MLKHCKIARIQFSKQEATLEVLEVDWRKRNVIEFMVGELVGAAVNWSRCSELVWLHQQCAKGVWEST